MIKIEYKRITVIFLFIMLFLGLWIENVITTDATATKKQELADYAQVSGYYKKNTVKNLSSKKWYKKVLLTS